MAQYVFTMNRVGKVVPPKKKILDDIKLPVGTPTEVKLPKGNGRGLKALLEKAFRRHKTPGRYPHGSKITERKRTGTFLKV